MSKTSIGGGNLLLADHAELRSGPEYFAPGGEWKELPAKPDTRPNATMYEMSSESYRRAELPGTLR